MSPWGLYKERSEKSRHSLAKFILKKVPSYENVLHRALGASGISGVTNLVACVDQSLGIEQVRISAVLRFLGFPLPRLARAVEALLQHHLGRSKSPPPNLAQGMGGALPQPAPP